jgi:branched-chain amino acid transport system permease protein
MVSAGIVVTYEAAGILNFSFGSMAYFVARFFYWLNTQHGWGLLSSGLIALLLVAPAMGIVLFLGVFRPLRHRSTLVKIVATIGLSVALPALALFFFGNQTISSAPGLSPEPVKFWNAFGATLTMDQVNIYVALVLVVVVGTVVLRFTDVGLKVRAMVDSEALTSLSGTNPNRVALGVWAVSGLLSGLAGILVAPTLGLTTGSMTLLMASAFAPVVAARLRSLSAAVAVALLMGVVTDVSQYLLPSNSALTADLVEAIPFVFMLIFLLYYLIRGGAIGQESVGGGSLDRAIRTDSAEQSAAIDLHIGGRGQAGWLRGVRSGSALLPLVVIALIPAVMSGYWLYLVAQGMALSVVLLSFSLVIGDGGMIWLCQITFAGGGALVAAELSSSVGIAPLPAALIAGLVIAPVGVLIGALTVRLGELYVALVTLAFGLLVETVVFTNHTFLNSGAGVPISRPSFALGDRSFAYFCFAILIVLGAVILNLRRSTTGLATTAVRWSEPAARTLGLSVVSLKVGMAGLAAFVAALGGALIAMFNMTADPTSFSTFTGLVWMAALVTMGLRSTTAAIMAGLAFMLLPGVFATYAPARWGSVPSVLFGLGAIAVAINPDGVVVTHARQLQNMLFRDRRSAQPESSNPDSHETSEPAVVTSKGVL